MAISKRQTEVLETAIRLMKDGYPAGYSQIAETTGLARGTLQHALARLVELGYMRQDWVGGPYVPTRTTAGVRLVLVLVEVPEPAVVSTS